MQGSPTSSDDFVPPSNSLRFGFLGAGNIAKSIYHGLVGYCGFKPQQMMLSAPSDTNLPYFRNHGSSTTHDGSQLFRKHENGGCNVIFLCVKPHQLVDAMLTVAKHLLPGQQRDEVLIISILAGKSLAQIREAFKPLSIKITLVRAVVNTALPVGEGICGLVVEDGASSQLKSFVHQLFLPMAPLTKFIPEAQIAAYGAAGGSCIAFCYELILALSDGGVKVGLARKMATDLAAQSMKGAAEMVLRSSKHPIDLRDAVCSPGGTTIGGIHAMNQYPVRGALIEAIEVTTNRAKDLSKV